MTVKFSNQLQRHLVSGIVTYQIATVSSVYLYPHADNRCPRAQIHQRKQTLPATTSRCQIAVWRGCVSSNSKCIKGGWVCGGGGPICLMYQHPAGSLQDFKRAWSWLTSEMVRNICNCGTTKPFQGQIPPSLGLAQTALLFRCWDSAISLRLTWVPLIRFYRRYRE